jgi:formylglycine-generating enzyme required for sulfatase activity
LKGDFQQAAELFESLCDLADEARNHRLEEIGAQDPELRSLVERMLAGDRRPAPVMDQKAHQLLALDTSNFERAAGSVAPEVLARLSERGAASSRYRIEREIGRGGMGEVHLSWDEDFERPLALKRIGQGDGSSGSKPGRRLQRFLDEARVTGQLDHPGVVPVHDLGIDSEGRAYFTMKYVKGQTLQEVLERVRAGDGAWNQTRVLGVLLRVCDAMAYAHSKGVVHRDLKPANIMVGRFGEVYVMDWGVAWLRSRKDERDLRPKAPTPPVQVTDEIRVDSAVFTMDGTVLGTPYYMSPEQARGGYIDERSDVYAIGAMLYTLLTGRPPHGDPDTDTRPYEVLKRVIEGPPESVHSLTQAPAELEAICEKAMARAPEQRYGSVSELGEDLRSYLEGRVVQAHSRGAIAELRKWMARNRAFASALGAALVFLTALLVVSTVLRRQAQASESAAKAASANALELMGFLRLDDFLDEADELWPARPDRIPALRDWLGRSVDIVPAREHLDGYQLQLDQVRARALPLTAEQAEEDRRAHPRFMELQRAEARLVSERRAEEVRSGLRELAESPIDAASDRLDARDLNERAWLLVDPDRNLFGCEEEGLALARLADLRVESDWLGAEVSDTLAWACFACGLDEEAREAMGHALDSVDATRRPQVEESAERLDQAIDDRDQGIAISQLTVLVDGLREEVSRRRTWTFASAEDRLWHNLLQENIRSIEALQDGVSGLVDGISESHGWGVERRLAWAETIEEKTVTGELAAQSWRMAIASIASREVCPAYDGLQIEPQVGLLPVGRDVDSGLWEFALLQTGEEPHRDEGGELRLEEDSALVLVLLPGGTFEMGAHPTGSLNRDPKAQESEGPVHPVRLSPFFLSKFEMTQGQWTRLTGHNPSAYSPTGERFEVDLRHPVETVSWDDCQRICRWLGARLPTEAEWEYAARAGTSTPWWTGSGSDSLDGLVNVADRSAQEGRAGWPEIDPDLRDGFVVHAPVTAFEPNAFGLYQVLGNVFEWCQDVYDKDAYAMLPYEDPVNLLGPGRRVSRGGSYRSTAALTRVTYRQNSEPGTSAGSLGLRPAMSLRHGDGR